MTRDRLVELLREHRGNLTAVARATSEPRTQVQPWIERFAVDPNEFRT